MGVVAVPDERLQVLSDLGRSQRIVPTAVEFVDIAGLVKGASEGEVSAEQRVVGVWGLGLINPKRASYANPRHALPINPRHRGGNGTRGA